VAGTTISIDFSPVTVGSATYAGLALQLSGSAGGNVNLGDKFVGIGSTGTLTWTLDSAAATYINGSTGLFGLQFYRNSNLGAADSIYVDNFQVNVTPVPEPSSFAAIAAVGALGFAATRRRRRVAD
jgi:hypothetical protein